MNCSDEKEYWEVIWEKFRAGDRRAFEIIYSEYVDALFAYGSRITHHRALLEDAIQDLFIEMYTYGGKLRKPQSLEFYLYKSLKRIIYRKLKEKYRFTHPDQLVELFELKFPVEEMEPDDQEERIRPLQDELTNLNPAKREILFLKFNSGLTYKEIGELLRINPDTVKKQVARVLKLLRGKLGEEFLELFVLFLRRKNEGTKRLRD